MFNVIMIDRSNQTNLVENYFILILFGNKFSKHLRVYLSLDSFTFLLVICYHLLFKDIFLLFLFISMLI